MDKIKIKVTSVSIDAEYNSISGDFNGIATSFVVGKDIDVAPFEGKTMNISTDENGAFIIEPAKVSK